MKSIPGDLEPTLLETGTSMSSQSSSVDDAPCAHLSETDAIAVVQLIGSIANSDQRGVAGQRLFMQKLADMLNADVWTWLTYRRGKGGRHVPTVILASELNSAHLTRMLACLEATDGESLDHYLIDKLISHRRHVTRRRRDLLGDDAWYRSAYFRAYRQDWLDDVVYSVIPHASDHCQVIGLHRAWGKSGFSSRVCQVMHVALAAVPCLFGCDGSQVEADAKITHLTPRLRMVVLLLSKGLSRKQIAYELGLSVATVAGYIRDIYRQLGISSRAQLFNHVFSGRLRELLTTDSNINTDGAA